METKIEELKTNIEMLDPENESYNVIASIMKDQLQALEKEYEKIVPQEKRDKQQQSESRENHPANILEKVNAVIESINKGTSETKGTEKGNQEI
ncbi:hypothetical protein JTB14_030047 [Gonioctena quinquepunctata]|nr:hypothetical protein JTB14_030047 [Gonioctena quinquepunctata]